MKKDKARDIARGVLPSTARRSAREDKRDFHHTHRRAQTQINHEIVRSTTVIDDDGYLYTDPDLFDDFEPRHVIDGYHSRTKIDGAPYDCDMPQIVYNRRNADNLGPLLSWARATERQKMIGWSVYDKYAYFKAVLPASLQGRHALGHVEQALDLSNDEFGRFFYYRRPAPANKEQFRAALAKLLSTSKGRSVLREFILETVPVAAHTVEAKNKIRSSTQARDESGNIRYRDAVYYEPSVGRLVISNTKAPLMVDVYIPQIVVTTCDDCSFLRNDPLATTEAVNRFVDIVWIRKSNTRYSRTMSDTNPHSCFYEVRNYILDSLDG